MTPTPSPGSITGEPFSIDGPAPTGDVGVLVLHGFTSGPASVQPWADAMAAQGFTVRAPLLPGHGTRWQDLNRTTFADWLAAATDSLSELSGRCGTVVVGGLSMGGTLSLRLAELHPEQVGGLILVNPSVTSLRKEFAVLPVLKYLVPSLAGIASDIAAPGVAELAYPRTPLKAIDSLRRAWPVVRNDLGRVRCPLLLLHSRVDHVVEPVNARIVLDGIGSTDVTEVVLERSYHVATLDHDAGMIAQRSAEFVARVAGVPR